MSKLLLVSLAALLCSAPFAVHGSVAGVIPARTGGFGETTCQQCHWENPLNEPSGRLTVDGVPEMYTPGERYTITVVLARPGLSTAGFQISAREDGINMNSGNDAGRLQPENASVETVQDAGKMVTYLQHSPAGTAVATAGKAVWTFSWTAPSGGAVVFHAAANAANGDDSPLGDYIYTAVVRSRPGEDTVAGQVSGDRYQVAGLVQESGARNQR